MFLQFTVHASLTRRVSVAYAEQRLHPERRTVPANDAPHRRVPLRVRRGRRHPGPGQRAPDEAQLPGPVPAHLLPLGTDFQPEDGGRDVEIQRHSHAGRHSQRERQGESHADHPRYVQGEYRVFLSLLDSVFRDQLFLNGNSVVKLLIESSLYSEPR